MDSEDPLFILYTSGSTGKPKGWFTPPLVIYTAYTFKNVFNYEENDIFGVRLILVGLQVILIFCMALLNGATTVIFEGTFVS
jgi:acetyl-CoA synthetase